MLALVPAAHCAQYSLPLLMPAACKLFSPEPGLPAY